MSPLFGNREEKAAKAAAGNAGVDRLLALSVPDLAAEIMPAFGADGPRGHGPNGGINLLQIIAFIARSSPGADKAATRLREPIQEGLQALEHASLIVRSGTVGGGGWYNPTRLGESVLADGSVRQHLASP
jgi:hypothetical protein